MSYEGFVQYMCENGHFYTVDAYVDAYKDVPKSCPFCDMRWAWRHSVDQTTGLPRDEAERRARMEVMGVEE